MKDFEGKSVLITGGTKGIGKACALEFSSRGAFVIMAYGRDSAAAQAALDEVQRQGGKGVLLQSDLSHPDGADKLWESVQTRNLNPETLILNGAYQEKVPALDTDAALMQRTFQMNVFAGFLLAKACIKHWIERKQEGVIVVHSSGQSTHVHPNAFAYAVSKAALDHMTRHLASVGAKHGIRINGVNLGWFLTEGERVFYDEAEMIRAARESVPMGRIGDPREAAKFTAFLAGDDCSYMTGSMLTYDGGYALHPDTSN
jgi:NAD(P)-dependent dehydrogenase (short-subunit alcohol dehydrogenase family)